MSESDKKRKKSVSKEQEPIMANKTKEEDVEEEQEEDVEEDLKSDVEPAQSSPLATCLGVLCFPFTACCSWFVVSEREEVVKLNFGNYTGSISEPGIHWANCCGRELRKVDKRIVSVDLPNTKVIEKNGNPLIVSAIVVYSIQNAKRATIDVRDVRTFIINEATAVLKRIVSMYPYEAHDENGKEDTMSLKNDPVAIQNKMTRMLQKHVKVAGAKIHQFRFNELSYAPEIAAGMLRRQQARAMVAARKKITQGAVEIAYGASDKLAERGVKMTPEEKKRLTSNLLAVIAADSDNTTTTTTAEATPTSTQSNPFGHLFSPRLITQY